jgi:predicted enzyme related to lactoylglutathione lyase
MSPCLLVVRSRDLGRAEQFYGRLGIAFVRHAHGGAEHLCADSDGVVFEIYPLGHEQVPTSSTRLGFRVADVVSAVRDLEAIGGQVLQAPRPSAWGLRAVVRDSDGHSVELLQEKAVR